MTFKSVSITLALMAVSACVAAYVTRSVLNTSEQDLDRPYQYFKLGEFDELHSNYINKPWNPVFTRGYVTLENDGATARIATTPSTFASEGSSMVGYAYAHPIEPECDGGEFYIVGIATDERDYHPFYPEGEVVFANIRLLDLAGGPPKSTEQLDRVRYRCDQSAEFIPGYTDTYDAVEPDFGQYDTPTTLPPDD